MLSLIRQCRGGRLNDPGFGSRHRGGGGAYADLIARRFAAASGWAAVAVLRPEGDNRHETIADLVQVVDQTTAA